MTLEPDLETLEKCPICGEKDSSIHLYTDIPPIDRPVTKWELCQMCGATYSNPRPTEAWLHEFYQEEYRKMTFGENDPNKNLRNVKEETDRSIRQISLITRFCEKNDRHLDIGSSLGVLLAAVQDKYNCDSVGVEPNPKYRDWTIERFEEARVKAIEGKMDINVTLPKLYAKLSDLRSEKKFELVTISHTLEHMTDPVDTLRRIRENHQKKGGLLMVETPNIFGTVGMASPMMFPHTFCFSSFTLPDIINRAGYSILDIETIGTCPPFYPAPYFLVVMAVNGPATYNKNYVLDRMRLQRSDQERIKKVSQAMAREPAVG
jgi:2-polyprenyl-3-methyl-5-hydroxy-6-metoxy-1,4-benzoquinol methylase